MSEIVITGTVSAMTVDGVPWQPVPIVKEAPGPSAALFNEPVYDTIANRYLSTTGSDSNDGLTAATAWKTIAKADSMALPPGTTVLLADGTYPQGQTILHHGGTAATPAGYVVYRAQNMGMARLQATGPGHMIVCQTNYLMFDGIEFDGNNNTCTGSGVESSNPAGGAGHHIWAINCHIHHCGQSGTQLNNREYLYVLHCHVHDNSSTSTFLGSGISFYEPSPLAGYTPTTMDIAQPGKVVANWNIVHDNFNPQNQQTSDGNGITFDDWRHTQDGTNVSYKGGGCVYGNLVYHNGGRGIQAFISENATIANNTVYNNNWDTHNPATWRSEIAVQKAAGVTVSNNIAYAIPGAGVLANNSPYTGQQSIAATNVWNNNIGFGHANNFGSPDTFPVPTNLMADPLFTNAAAGDFTLKPGSPAIGFGADGSNAGCYQ